MYLLKYIINKIQKYVLKYFETKGCPVKISGRG